MVRAVTKCPVCDASLRVTELSCAGCDTRLRGVFPPPPLARLADEHQHFLTTFLLCRGVIRDVEKELGISYPTVRARLDAAVSALEVALSAAQSPAGSPQAARHAPASPTPSEVAERRRELLRQVEEGLLEPAEAAEALRHV